MKLQFCEDHPIFLISILSKTATIPGTYVKDLRIDMKYFRHKTHSTKIKKKESMNEGLIIKFLSLKSRERENYLNITILFFFLELNFETIWS